VSDRPAAPTVDPHAPVRGPGPGPAIAVVGAGISGLAAAHRMVAAGARVTVFEAADRPGGQLRSVEVRGHTVDVGAEAAFTAAPGPLRLIETLGLDDQVVPAAPGTTWIWTDRGLRPLPAGFGPAGPSRLRPVLTARVLSPAGILRAGLEPLLPRTRVDDDLAVGTYLQRRFGREVTDRLVDPLLGGLHAGDVRRLSLTAATPQLAARASARRSLLLGTSRARPSAAGPGFVSLRAGMAALPVRLAAQLPFELRLGTPVARVVREGSRLRLVTQGGDATEVDGIVLATPAHVAARIVRGASAGAGAGLAHLRAASVAVAVLAYPAAAAETPALRGTGLLVPSTAGRLLKAATFLSTKWPHHGGSSDVLVRVSAGRADDARPSSLSDGDLVDRLHAELREATGLAVDPVDARVQRWPSTMPQLEVGHRGRLAAIRTALRRDLPGVRLAGAPYDGPGIAACLRSGTEAADQLLDQEPAR
jgi:protoporphyrinogen/coproporphyrinogen III oxidase